MSSKDTNKFKKHTRLIQPGSWSLDVFSQEMYWLFLTLTIGMFTNWKNQYFFRKLLKICISRHHIDVVLAFNKYLKTHCAVGEVYFALDPHSGITSESNHDPWKWAQDTMEKISNGNGFVIFIAGMFVFFCVQIEPPK